MGKYRGHQDKSRRGREKKLLKKKVAAARGGGGTQLETAGSRGRPQLGKAAAAAAGGLAGAKRKLKHVTYAKEHSVLICGDGDFSFTRGVIRHRGTGKGVVATSLDSRGAVLKKYPRAETWLAKLDADGAQVVHSIDATRLEETLLGKGGDGGGEEGEGKKHVLFDRVVFNFPHTGKQRTHLNRNLIRDFFASTKGLVKCAPQGGEVHVTLKDKPPYSGWNVKAMAKESELILVRTLEFDPSVFPGYRHSTTDPQAKEFDAGGARTNVFCRAKSPLDENIDVSGAFPVIVQPAAVSGDVHTSMSSADNNGSLNPGAKETDCDEDSDGDLFGNGGGDGEFDSEDETGTKDVASGGGGDRTSDSGKKGRSKNNNKKGDKGGPLDGGGGEGEGEAEGETGMGDKESESSKRGMLQPPVQKKKAAKRRAQRKKKAAAAKEAAAAAAAAMASAGEVSQGPVSSPSSGGKAKTPKRKRGKYVVFSKKRPRDGEE